MKPPLANARRLRPALLWTALCLLSACQPPLPDARPVSRRPDLYPDYADTVIAPNVAPLNFRIREPGERFVARLAGENGKSIEVSSRDGRVVWPARAWSQLLARNRGAALRVTVTVQGGNGSSRRFDAIRIDVAPEPLDRYLVYRLIPPLDHYSVDMGIYERDLEGFAERPVIENKNFSVGRDGCMNCHSFRRNRTDRMSLQIRSAALGRLMVFTKDGVTRKVDTAASGFGTSPAAYQDWHPDGRHIAFSVNKVRPLEHTIGEHRDAWDDDSDIGVYDTETNRVATSRDLADTNRRESWPSWSADGRTLYFVSAPQLPVTEWRHVKYDLMRIAYDAETGQWGTKETLLSAAASGLSAAQPKESPDGRWLMFLLADHGSFPVYQSTSSLYVIDRRTGERRPLPAINRGWNAWHGWSSNGRWVVFASKREGGVFGRIYFSYFDEQGQAHKPFVLPQEDPSLYESSTFTYNLPELNTESVPLSASQLGRAIATTRTLPAPTLTIQ